MARRLTVVSDHLGIVELGQICAAMRARSLDLFAELGQWVSTTSPSELQRLFAEACHRHAWHAELWGARMPTIPSADGDSASTVDHADVAGDDTRRDHYRRELSSLEDELRSVRARFDPTLDPSTARTIDLVGRDVVEISARLDSLRVR